MMIGLMTGFMSVKAETYAPVADEPPGDKIEMTWTVEKAREERSFSFIGKNGGAYWVRWGDGTQDTLTGAGDGIYVQGIHEYAEPGVYDVKVFGLPYYYQEDYTEAITGVDPAKYKELEMVFVAGGSFNMGCMDDKDTDCHQYETPSHQVSLDDFYISRYEVTMCQWKYVMGNDGVTLNGKMPDWPAYKVPYDSAMAFCRKLSELTGKHYTLPTEAQWEYASRGGQKSQGYIYSGSDDIDEVAHYNASPAIPGNVGAKKANELGIYDMSGNVCEWCQDVFLSYTDANKYPDESQVNPSGPTAEVVNYRMVRGGSLRDGAISCRNTARSNGSAFLAPSQWIGFRVVCIP